MPGSRQNLHGVSAPLENASRDRCADAQLVIKSVASEAPEDYPELWLPVPLNRLMSVRGNRRWRSLALLCWLVFAAGLLVQLLSPHLKISNGAFVIPPEMATGRNAIRPDEIIARQRRIQLLSVLLTVSGALGLAFLYRDILIGAASRRSSEPVEEPACADSMRSQHPDATRKTLDEENHTKKTHTKKTHTK
jgi:hypothetical protein